MMKLTILGSTGSIGTQALEVAKKQGYSVQTLTANKSVKLLEQQIREFSPKTAVMADEKSAKELKTAVADTATKVLCGYDNVVAASQDDSDIVLNALVGISGLLPTLGVISAGKKLALANKESLVTGGELVMRTAHENGVPILPVDSEHSAVFQCLQAAASNAPKKIILTASGGPFFGYSREQLKAVTAEKALCHPNWSMGAKITIDSATMMNKGFEIIEAIHLFGVKPNQVEVLVHRESIVHSMIEFCDNSVLAQLGLPDMRIPIQYALTYPARFESPVSRLSLTKVATLSFFEPDYKTFGCLEICKKAIAKGGLVPCAVNAANEIAVSLFLQGKIGFLDIESIAQMAFESQKQIEYTNVNEIIQTDRTIRELVLSKYG